MATALVAARAGLTVATTEEYDWIGGQMTSQGVPPDEVPWVEQFGITASYRALRDGIRHYYRRNYPARQRHRQQTADLAANSPWRSQPAIVKKTGNFYLPALQL